MRFGMLYFFAAPKLSAFAAASEGGGCNVSNTSD